MNAKTLLTLSLSIACATSALPGLSQDTGAVALDYKTFTSKLLPLAPGHTGLPTFAFMGSRKGKPCALIGSMARNNEKPGSSLHLVVAKDQTEGEWFQGGILIVSGDKIVGKALNASGTDYLYQSESAKCSGKATIMARFKKPTGELSDISAIHLRETPQKDCTPSSSQKPYRASCDNLSFFYAETPGFKEKATELAKTVASHWGVPASKFTKARSRGCSLAVSDDPTVSCEWDVSNDPDGDTGTNAIVYFKMESGTPVAVVRTCSEEKYTGDVTCP
jgi:hypothetical protein